MMEPKWESKSSWRSSWTIRVLIMEPTQLVITKSPSSHAHSIPPRNNLRAYVLIYSAMQCDDLATPRVASGHAMSREAVVGGGDEEGERDGGQ